MTMTFLAVITVMVVINVFMIFVLRKISRKVDRELSILCIRGMASLGEFNEAEIEQAIDQQANASDKEINEMEELRKKIRIEHNFKVENKIRASVVYKNIDFLSEYKAVKYAMQFDKEDVVRKFLGAKWVTPIKELQPVKSVMGRYSFDLLFNIAVLDEDNQLEIIESMLLEQEKLLLTSYISQYERFECIDFMYYVQKEFYKYDDAIYIKTGNPEENFDKLDSRIKTIYDPAICEGVKIIYNNYLYDYSI